LEPSASSLGTGYYWWKFVQPMYVPGEGIKLTFGTRLTNDKGNQYWTNDELLSDKIEPILNQANMYAKQSTITAFIIMLKAMSLHSIRTLEAYFYTLAYVNKLDEALKVFYKLQEMISQSEVQPNWMHQLEKTILNFLSLNEEKKSTFFDNVKEDNINKIGLVKFHK
jgi:hypothetical protein